MNKKTIAIILAAGDSTRARVLSGVKKQYAKIAENKTVLETTITTFAMSNAIDHIAVVIHPDDIANYSEATFHCQSKLLPYILGGARRQDSVLNGLRAIAEYNPKYVLIHDAARIYVDDSLIYRVVSSLSEYNAVIPAVKVSDTLKYVSAEMMVDKTLPRDNLFYAQTPQGFDYGMIKNLHERYRDLDFTDDAALVEHDGGKVKIIESNFMNFKITINDDLNWARIVWRGLEKNI